MSERKIKWAFFTIAEHEKEQIWLQEQHRRGYKFLCANPLGIYHFEKCEPEEVVYQLDYNFDGREHRAEYLQMFADCGWEYVTEVMGYSYFRKPVSEMKGEEEIFGDEDSKLEMVERVFKGRMIPLFIIFFLIILPQLFIQSRGDNAAADVLFGTYGVLFALYVFLFVQFGYQYWKLKKRMGK